MNIDNLFSQHKLSVSKKSKIDKLTNLCRSIANLINDGNIEESKTLLPELEDMIHKESIKNDMQYMCLQQFIQIRFWIDRRYENQRMQQDKTIPIMALLSLRMWFTANIAINETQND